MSLISLVLHDALNTHLYVTAIVSHNLFRQKIILPKSNSFIPMA